METKNVAILIFDQVEVLDFAGPFEIFSRTRLVPGAESRRSEDSAPFQVFTVAKTDALIRAVGDLEILPKYSFEDAPRADIVVIPGGWGTRALLEDTETLDWIRTASAAAERTASVCTGALLLAKAGLLEGRRATTHWAALDLLESLGGVQVDRTARVVRDGIYTSAGVAAGIDLAFDIVEEICGREVADETAHYIEYRRNTAGFSVAGASA
ncbi:MAG: DJ-1/PfpI family protein [Candidatus Acidiferrales bacterium]